MSLPVSAFQEVNIVRPIAVLRMFQHCPGDSEAKVTESEAAKPCSFSSRRIPVVNSGLNHPLSADSSANRRIAERGRFIVAAESARLSRQERYRTTAQRLNPSRGSEQYQSMNLSMAYLYVRRECADGKVASTLILDCSSSGIVRFAVGLGDLACCFEVGIGSGSFDRSL